MMLCVRLLESIFIIENTIILEEINKYEEYICTSQSARLPVL